MIIFVIGANFYGEPCMSIWYGKGGGCQVTHKEGFHHNIKLLTYVQVKVNVCMYVTSPIILHVDVKRKWSSISQVKHANNTAHCRF
jgi:hypothetical protein